MVAHHITFVATGSPPRRWKNSVFTAHVAALLVSAAA
jgi:hypothetical protein